jgi:sialate O-acetylesterase
MHSGSRSSFWRYGVALSLLTVLSGSAAAEVRLATIFSEHMVLQRERELPVWGWATPGERVQVAFGHSAAEAIADELGRWSVRLPAQPANSQPQSLTVTGPNTITLRDVLVGDVWLCSGQSNMDIGLHSCDAADEIAAAELPLIRHFRTQYNFAAAPAADVQGHWSVCTPHTAGGFSAVGFYFARRIQAQTQVPIGLITNAVGGTNIELWMSQETLLETAELEPYARQMRASLADYRRQLATALPALEDWTARSRAALAAGEEIPLLPQLPDFPFGERLHRPRCVTLHNGHIAPLLPLSLRGVLWYQGENNADGHLYVEKKRAMVAAWRRWFRDADLPLYYVQLAAWQQPNADPAGGEWGPIRDAQRRCLTIPGTGMASAIDLGDAEDIHPKNKADVGERLALWALRDLYGQRDVVVSGPIFREMEIEGQRVRLQFDHVGGGLVSGTKAGRAPVEFSPEPNLQRFAIAGADRRWHWAEAVIEGETVVVSSPQVPAPVAVRYAYCSNPAGANLYNRAGLPAAPFRTDDW